MFTLEECEPPFRIEDCSSKFDLIIAAPSMRLEEATNYFSVDSCAPATSLDACLPTMRISEGEIVVLHSEQKNIRNFKPRVCNDANDTKVEEVVARTSDFGLRLLQLIDEQLGEIDETTYENTNPAVIDSVNRIKKNLSEVKGKIAQFVSTAEAVGDSRTAA